MDFLGGVFCLCITWILIQAFYVRPRRRVVQKKLPPGPKPFPVVGNLLELGDKPHKSLAKLAGVHGPIISLKLGKVTAVVISSADLVREVFQIHDRLLADRTIPDVVRAYHSDEYSLPWIPVSSRWRNLRKICTGELFAHGVLDAYGDIRQKKVKEFLAQTHQSSLTGEAVDIGKAAFTTALNLLSNTIFSADLAGPDSGMAGELKELFWNIMKEIGKPNLADYFPVLKKFDPQGLRRRMEVYAGKIMVLLDGIIDQRLQSREVPGSIINNDFLDILLNKREEDREKMDRTMILHLLRIRIKWMKKEIHHVHRSPSPVPSG